jgi:hypothetical protein
LSFFRCEIHRLESNLVVAAGQIAIYRPEAMSHWSNNVFYSRTGAVTGYPVDRYDPGKPFTFRNAGVIVGPDPAAACAGDSRVSCLAPRSQHGRASDRWTSVAPVSAANDSPCGPRGTRRLATGATAWSRAERSMTRPTEPIRSDESPL